MTTVAVEITTRPASGLMVPPLPFSPKSAVRPASPEPVGLIIVEDAESLADGTIPGCNDDNPYQ
ncbi:hypothetical protein AB0N93_21090 [Streptomyces sp. NPDC091267]|uniref:hypothetical protein n=1 Tax=Streptomyces sp. NPDC091267 TaxID=3155195 RepID=UPI00342C3B40